MIRPDDLRPWATSPEVSRELRAMLSGAPAGSVLLVLLSGTFPPESIPVGAWRVVEGYRVAVVQIHVARDLATGRSRSAGEALSRPPREGGAWCLALAADGTALTWSTPITFTHKQVAPGDPGEDLFAADAYGPSQGDA